MKIKRIALIAVIAISLLFIMSAQVFATGFSLSPVETVINVSADGEAVQEFQITNFNGSIEISSEGIPLTIEPNIVIIDASETTKTFGLTIYGDESLGEQTFEGTINFLPRTNDSVVIGIKVLTTIHQTVDRSGTPVMTYVGIGGGCVLLIVLVIAIIIRRRKS